MYEIIIAIMKNLLILLLTITSFKTTVIAQVGFKKIGNDKIEVTIAGKKFTNYYYPVGDNIKKPILYPVLTPNGEEVTRGYPLNPRYGERADHPHHIGVWFNFESVNGHDYWNNSANVDHNKYKYGSIIPIGKVKIKKGKKSGSLLTKAQWIDSHGNKVIDESTHYVFSSSQGANIVDRITTLKAIADTVLFKDAKDGLFAIRVNRALEHPNDKADIFIDSSGMPGKKPILDFTKLTGNYRNAQGIEGEKTWGLRSEWVTLEGVIESDPKSITIIDHPKNVNYPSYWHTRGYGLFSINPLGESIFTKGQKATNLRLKKGDEVTFRYRLVIADKHFTNNELNQLNLEFITAY